MANDDLKQYLAKQFEGIGKRFAGIDKRLDAFPTRDEVNARFDEVTSMFGELREYVDEGLTGLERRTQVRHEELQASVNLLVEGQQALTDGQEVLRRDAGELRTGQQRLEGQVAGLAAGQARLEKIVSPQ